MRQVHLILGEEEFLAERIRHNILQEIGPQAERTILSAGELTVPELIDVTSPSLFSEDRAVIVKNTEAAGKEPTELLLKAAVDPALGIYLIIQHSGGGRNKSLVPKFKKIAEVHEANPVAQRDLHGWVTNEFRSHGVRPTPDVVAELTQAVGSDLRELASAVSQLVADTDGEITIHTVRAYYTGVAEVSSFDIADLAVAGQTAKAVASARRALQLGEKPAALSAALANKVGTIARLHTTRGGNSNQLAGQLGLHPYVVKKTMPIARRWSPEAVSQAVIIVADLDDRVKGQGGDAGYEIESAVRKISQLAG